MTEVHTAEDEIKQVIAYLDKRNEEYEHMLKNPTDCPITFGDNIETLTFKHKDKSVTITLEKLFKFLKEMEEQ